MRLKKRQRKEGKRATIDRRLINGQWKTCVRSTRRDKEGRLAEEVPESASHSVEMFQASGVSSLACVAPLWLLFRLLVSVGVPLGNLDEHRPTTATQPSHHEE